MEIADRLFSKVNVECIDQHHRQARLSSLTDIPHRVRLKENVLRVLNLKLKGRVHILLDLTEHSCRETKIFGQIEDREDQRRFH